jgi:hypothetical protein
MPVSSADIPNQHTEENLKMLFKMIDDELLNGNNCFELASNLDTPEIISSIVMTYQSLHPPWRVVCYPYKGLVKGRTKIRLATRLITFEKGPIKDEVMIDIDSIELDVHKVSRYQMKNIEIDTKRCNGLRPIFVLVENGRYKLIDGYFRIWASKMTGKKLINAKVFTLEEIKELLRYQ